MHMNRIDLTNCFGIRPGYPRMYCYDANPSEAQRMEQF